MTPEVLLTILHSSGPIGYREYRYKPGFTAAIRSLEAMGLVRVMVHRDGSMTHCLTSHGRGYVFSEECRERIKGLARDG